jgi:hypothetical protein
MNCKHSLTIIHPKKKHTRHHKLQVSSLSPSIPIPNSKTPPSNTNHCPPASLLLLEHNLLRHGIDNLAIKLGRLAAWETNLLSQIIGQQIQQFFVALLVEKGLVYELRVFVVGVAGGGDGEVEV